LRMHQGKLCCDRDHKQRCVLIELIHQLPPLPL